LLYVELFLQENLLCQYNKDAVDNPDELIGTPEIKDARKVDEVDIDEDVDDDIDDEDEDDDRKGVADGAETDQEVNR
jgi:hypothetical protein